APPDRILMDDMQRIPGLLHVQPGDRAPRTADEVKGSAARLAQHWCLFQSAVDRLVYSLAVVAQLRQAQRPKRQTDRLIDFPRLHPHQFDAAAAEIADDAIRIRDPGEDAGRGERPLLGAADDSDRHAALALGLRDKGPPVARFAHSGGSDNRDVINLKRPRERDKTLEVTESGVDSLRVEPTAAADGAPKGAHDLLVEQRQ